MTWLSRLKEKNFSEVRKWVVNNLDNDPGVLIRSVYDVMMPLENNSIPVTL